MTDPIQITLGPLYFNWSPEEISAFYARIADEAPVDRVYLGETICGKRAPINHDALRAAADRLASAGKEVVWSTLAMPATAREAEQARSLAAGGLVEINDVGALRGRPEDLPFVAGPLLNIYGEAAAQELMSLGCRRLCMNVELSIDAASRIASACPGLEIELFAFGRLPLALSGRCYHARMNGLTKDSCMFICKQDPDGAPIDTLEGQAFLAVNGVQTLSHGVQLADLSRDDLHASGVKALRLSPQTADMVRVARAFRNFLDGQGRRSGLRAAVRSAALPGPLVNGYLFGDPGHVWRPHP